MNGPSKATRCLRAALPPLLAAAIVWLRFEPCSTAAGLILLAYLPGRIVQRACGIGRQWDRAGQAILSVALSLGLMPVILNPIWHLGNQGPYLLAFITILICAAAIIVALLESPRRTGDGDFRCFDGRPAKIVFLGCALVVAFATIGPYWPTELHGYPLPSLIHDFIKHHAVLFSLEQRPLPLGNPFYAGEAAGPVYYYHFFYLIPATLRACSPVLSIELAFGLCSALAGIVIAGLVHLFVKRFTRGDGPAALAVLLATVIGGLDVLPLAYLRLPVISLDAWADHPVRIHSLLTQMVWSPQNMLAILIMLTGAYILSEKSWWRGWLVLGPLLAAAAFGASPWVAMALFPGLVFFVIHELRRYKSETAALVRNILAAATVALLTAGLALSSLLGYAEMSRRLGKSLTIEWPHHANAFFGKLLPPGPLANWLDLPWILALEMGPLLLFPLFLPRHVWRRVWNDPGARLLLISAVIAVAAYATVRSHFTYNDFGQKIMLVALSAGVVLAALVIAPQPRPPTWWNPCGWALIWQTPQRPRRAPACLIGAALILGMPLGVFQSPLLAARRYLTHIGPLSALATPATKRAELEADANRFLRRELPPASVIQADPGPERLDLAQLARKQIGITILERDTMVFSPRESAAHERTLSAARRVLEQSLSAEECHAVLKSCKITHVYVGLVERAAWRGLEKFEDPRYFRAVHVDDRVTVYALE